MRNFGKPHVVDVNPSLQVYLFVLTIFFSCYKSINKVAQIACTQSYHRYMMVERVLST